MKPSHLLIASAAVALLGGAAYAQQPAAPTPGSVTGDWNGSHAPSDDRQYKEKTPAPVAEAPPPAPVADVTAPAAPAAAENASATMRVTAMQPIPDTKENRAQFPPLSHAGRRTTPRGN